MVKPEDFYFKGQNGTGEKITEFICTNKDCQHKTGKVQWADRDEDNSEPVSASCTLGFGGPNGNGYNYWCRKCGHRVIFQTSYSALDAFFGKLW